jgi:ribonucleoside-diphosphate reductase alpha chain
MMDDIVDLELEAVDRIIAKIESDPEPEAIKWVELNMWKTIKKKAQQGRRTGYGITAVGDMLAALNITYGSDESIDFIEKVMQYKKHQEYRTSMMLAKERGAFPIWDADREKHNPFLQRIQKEDDELYKDLQKHGRRNIAISTIAPTGTTSLMAGTSSGIENVFMPVYFRSKKVNPNDANVRVDYVDEVGDAWQEFPVFHPHFKTFLKVKGLTDAEIKKLTTEEADDWVKKSPYYNATAQDVDLGKKG